MGAHTNALSPWAVERPSLPPARWPFQRGRWVARSSAGFRAQGFKLVGLKSWCPAVGWLKSPWVAMAGDAPFLRRLVDSSPVPAGSVVANVWERRWL